VLAGNEPGHAASDEVRHWWRTTAGNVTPFDELRSAGRSLREFLCSRSEAVCGDAVRLDDLSAGTWRRVVGGADESAWPPAFVPFERTKYRCMTRAGKGLLWKSAGLAADGRGAADMAAAAAARQGLLARGNWTVAPVDTAFGFVATPWVDGVPLSAADGASDPTVLAHVGRYVADAARADIPDVPVPAYGDGRLAPHEWRRATDRRLLKTDCTGHELDHTIVGRQPIFWDLAGAIVEWAGGSTSTAEAIQRAYLAGGGRPSNRPVLRFYRTAYAAFRLGMCAMWGVLGRPESMFRQELMASLWPSRGPLDSDVPEARQLLKS
jgi:hypothetical protein